jgi:hypothetical protein
VKPQWILNIRPAPVGSRRATAAIDDDSDGLPRITPAILPWLEFGFLFRQQRPQFCDERNELLGFGLTSPPHLDVRLTTYTRGPQASPKVVERRSQFHSVFMRVS